MPQLTNINRTIGFRQAWRKQCCSHCWSTALTGHTNTPIRICSLVESDHLPTSETSEKNLTNLLYKFNLLRWIDKLFEQRRGWSLPNWSQSWSPLTSNSFWTEMRMVNLFTDLNRELRNTQFCSEFKCPVDLLKHSSPMTGNVLLIFLHRGLLHVKWSRMR